MEEKKHETDELKEIDELIKKRTEKLIEHLKKRESWVIIGIIILLLLGFYIRAAPMFDREDGMPGFLNFIFSPMKYFDGRPGLWDITKNTWALGPDLDPWLFFRYAKYIVEQGRIPKIDKMRYVPHFYETAGETWLLPYLIAFLYYILSFFKNVSIEFAAVFLPVVMFELTIVSFFLFVREIFVRKDRESRIKANIIGLIATLFLIVFPVFLPRTIAGIPEKESAAFFFMFLAFYLFLRAIKEEREGTSYILAFLSGLSTLAMGLIWGGFIYIFISIALASFVSLMIGKFEKKEYFVYFIWFLTSFILIGLLYKKYSFITLATSTTTGIALGVFVLILAELFLRETYIVKQISKRWRIPQNLVIAVLSFFAIVVIVSIVKPSFVINELKNLHQIIFKPVIGRWNITVAENRQPYFSEWALNFGPFLKHIPLTFWLFILGSILLFNKAISKKFSLKDRMALILTYIFFIFGMIFSRYSPQSVFNGENLISQIFFYFAAFSFIATGVYLYIKYYREGKDDFKRIDFEYILFISNFILGLYSARGAVRLIMMLAPIASILIGFVNVESVERFRNSKDETMRLLWGVTAVVFIAMTLYSFWGFYNGVKIQAYNYVPSSYNIQWQKAMSWVRNETPENAVFSHWWDYGYWVQSIGERPTIVDGGNSIAYWNYLVGRFVLTGDNESEALNFLYSHNVSYLLIDPTDIGKYGAFSSIGSDRNYDRYSWFGTFVLDDKRTQETKNATLLFYAGGIALDEDLVVNESGKEILLPRQAAGIGAVVIPVIRGKNRTRFEQPYIILVYKGLQYKVKLKYIYVDGKFKEFSEGVNGVAYVVPQLFLQGERVYKNNFGAVLLITPRHFRGLFAHLYLLNDPLKRYPHFELVHKEPNLLVDELKKQGLDLGDFVYVSGTGMVGPIKMWKVNYTGNEVVKKEYLDIDYRKYLDWKL